MAILSWICGAGETLLMLPDAARIWERLIARISTHGACGVGPDTSIARVTGLVATIVA